ncbi:LOW QUALITY PROTEIN: hypothetical protein QTO34_012846 [Cnephaeus nilssonii]|uniref:Uncharacterized protein n=1 Tax=Cnephaeus nilssonii TaxID=3371016 RepID=A0AA40HAK3_CNENI|nr:LOW QUALITY PROTEIN: hypothetical protein QTO34_012846 [Eptesicus nilssonii]
MAGNQQQGRGTEGAREGGIREAGSPALAWVLPTLNLGFCQPWFHLEDFKTAQIKSDPLPKRGKVLDPRDDSPTFTQWAENRGSRPSKVGELGACLLWHQAFQKPPPSRRLLKGLVHQRTGTQLHHEKRKRAACHRLREGYSVAATGVAGSSGHCRAGLVPQQLLSGQGTCSLAQPPGPLPVAPAGLDCHSSCYDAWAVPDPSMTAGSLPGLGPLTGLPSSALTAEELKYTDIHNTGAMIAPLHSLDVKLGKRPQPVKSELDEEEGRRKRCWGKNKKKEQEEFLQRESEWLELMNVELKTQMEELKQEQQQLILMLNQHCLTCIVRTDSVKTPTQKATHCWNSWKNDHGLDVEKKREEEEEEEERKRRRRRVPEGSSLLHEKLFNEAQHSQHWPGFYEAGQRLLARETPNQAAVGTSPASPPGHPPKGPPSSQEKP